jgi:ABC-type branched-subunit amino acid transport system substrate-binding protein
MEVCITRTQSTENTYLVSASEIESRNPIKTAQATFTIDIEQQLEVDLKSFGIKLFNTLFRSEVKKLYDEIKIRARKQRAVIRLRLQIKPPELSTLPWELLYDDKQYLCLSRNPKILFARVPAALVEKESQPYRPPLHLLAVTASPDGQDKLALEKGLNTALQNLIREKRIEIAWERATPEVIHNHKLGDPWYILHFIGHFDVKGDPKPNLIFENAQGESYGIDAHRLSLALHENIQLVFLHACATPHRDQAGYLSHFAYQLAASGIPAIVALQRPITDKTALQFTKVFYERVAHGDAVEEAVTRARHHIYGKAGSLAWMAPILYISTSNSISFKETSTVSVVSESGNPVSPPVADHPQPPLPPKPKRFLFGINRGAVVLIFLLIFALIFVSIFSSIVWPPPPLQGIGTFKAPNGELIGISDGRYPFDTERASGPHKNEAAKALQQNKAAEAIAHWQAAIAQDPGDAEASIYLENQRVLSSNKSYINFVLGVAMAGNGLPLSRKVLQGAYEAQHEYNQSHNGQVRLLIASRGTDRSSYVKMVAEQILRLAKEDRRTVAVMGWTDSSSTHNALPILVKEPLVMLSQHASNTLLTGISPYFFRIIPPNEVQAEVGAKYAREELKINNVAIFGDATDPYSQDLAASFGSKFTAKGGKIVASASYKGGEIGPFQSLLEGALKNNPDLIYFAGHASDIRALLALLPTTGKFAQLRVMAGDAGGGVENLSKPANYHRLIYTAFAHSDAWEVAGSERPPFLDEYRDEYSIVSYDAINTLLAGYEIALEQKLGITPDALRHALTQITGSRSLQGVSGQISFDVSHDPVKKPVFIIQVRQDGQSYIISNGIRGGCYIKGCV